MSISLSLCLISPTIPCGWWSPAQALAANIREVLNVGAFFPGDRTFSVEFVTEFHVERTPPEGGPGAQWKEGDVIVMNQMVLYDVDEDGKFKHIRIFHHRYLDPAEAKH